MTIQDPNYDHESIEDYKSYCITPWLSDLWFADDDGSPSDIFDVELAMVLGIHESIVLHKLVNIDKRLHHRDDTRPNDTMTAIPSDWVKNYFPYLTERQFLSAVRNLLKSGIIEIDLKSRRLSPESFDTVIDLLTISLNGLKPFLQGVKRFKNPRIKNEQEEEKEFYKVDDNPVSVSYCQLKKGITEEDTAQLAQMRYVEFLKSDYWATVRNYVLYKRGEKCFLCPATSNLHVHHKTYEHRGCEIHHLDDLVILCKECHARHHDKLG